MILDYCRECFEQNDGECPTLAQIVAVRTKQRSGRTPARMSKRKWDQTGDGLDDTPSKVSKTEDGKSASEAAAAAVSIPATNHHPLKPVGSRCSALLTVFFYRQQSLPKLQHNFQVDLRRRRRQASQHHLLLELARL
jgi:hypothetical protein